MAEIEVLTETEGQNHWAYTVRIREGGQSQEHQVTLSWADYDHWSHGRVAPEKVVQKIFEFLLAREPASSILPKFDCSLVRRYFPEIDGELPKMV